MADPYDREILEHHLKYEFDMLLETLRRPANADVVHNNALIESFCVHARNLVEFFGKEKNNAKPPRFTDGAYVPFALNPLPPNLQQRLNNQISHLIFQGRTDDENKKIDYSERIETAKAICKDYLEFRKHLRKEFSTFNLPDVTFRQTINLPNHLTTTSSATNAIMMGSTGPYR